MAGGQNMYQQPDSVAKITTELELLRLMSGNLSKGRLSAESGSPSAAKTRLRAFRAKARELLKQNKGGLIFSIRQSEFLSGDGVGGSKLDGLILVDDSKFPLNPQESKLRYYERSGKDFDREDGYLVRKLHAKSALPNLTSITMLRNTLNQDLRWMQGLIQMESASGRPPLKTDQIFFLVLNQSGTDYNVVNVTAVFNPSVSADVGVRKQAVAKPAMQEEKQPKRKVEMKPELTTEVKHVSGGSLSFDEWYLLASGLLSVLTPRLSEAGKDLTVQPFYRSVSEFVELCGQYDRSIKTKLDELEDAKETLSKMPKGDAYKMKRQHAATYCETVNKLAQKVIYP